MTGGGENPILEAVVDTPCPHCGAAPLLMRSLPMDLPYFGAAVQTSVLCRACPYRRSDLVLERSGPPTRHELRVDDGDLTAKIARSPSGTVRIPELDVAVEPGPRAESFVTNAEGVLARIEEILDFARRNADSPATRGKAEHRLREAREMRAGRRSFTIVLDDPEGSSRIVHPRATRRELSGDEASRLKGGPPMFRLGR